MAVASPCVGVCKLDRKTDLCVGCLRTAAEIRRWRQLTDAKRRRVMAERRRREAKLAARGSRR